MNATAQTVFGKETPGSSRTEYNMLAFIFKQLASKMQTISLVQVISVQPGAVGPVGTVTVQPMVNQISGNGQPTPHGYLYEVPYFRMQGGMSAFILDPQPGDIGLAAFCSRDTSAVKASKAVANPNSPSTMFDWADGMYLGGYLNGTPQNYVQFMPDGTLKAVSTVAVDIQAPEVNVTTTGNVNINGAIISSAGEVTDALGIVLGTHKHSGVQTGAGDTGPPVP